MTKPTKPQPTKPRSRKPDTDNPSGPERAPDAASAAPETSAPETSAPDTSAPDTSAATSGTPRPLPAAPGTLASTEIGAGKPAQAGQPGEITPIESSLVGAGGGLPAAAPKPASDKPAAASAGPASDRPKSTSAPVPPATSPASRRETPRRGGFLPLALGGAVAAGLGAAAAILVLPQLPPEWQPAGRAAPEAAAPEPAPVDEEAIRSIVAAELAARPAPEPAAPGEAQLPPEIAQQLEEQAQRLAALEGAEAPEQPDLSPQIEQLTQQLAAQAQQIEELAARPAFDPEAATAAQQQIEQAAAEAEERLAAAQAEADALQAAAAESTRRAEAVAAIAALQAALDEGVTPEDARQRLEAVGVESPEALNQPVASLAELQAGFPEASRAALRASYQTESAQGGGNVITNFLRAQTGARSVAPREGDDPDAILSRANAEIQAGRVAPALDQLAGLPEPARAAPAMADWLTRAEGYIAAQAALSDLSAQSN